MLNRATSAANSIPSRVQTINRTADYVIDAFTLSIPCSMFLSL